MKRAMLFAAAGLAIAGSAATVPNVTPAVAATAGAGGNCAGLTAGKVFEHMTVSSANAVAADASKGMPAYCQVTAVISPAPGSTIGVVYRLPEGWNGKLLGLGGGGWAGNVTLMAAAQGLQHGYATAQTDGGHATTSPWDTAWAANPESQTDFAYRAIHLMTAGGKAVVAKFYGKRQEEAYYQGCSTGGRQGLMEVQRYPADYDGVITGAPVYSLLVQTSAVLRNQTFNAPGAGFTADQFAMVNKAVLAACDAKDGLADGIIADPSSCSWDPGELQCKAGAAGGDCLTDAQVNALRTAYRGIQEVDGRVAAWPLARGGEPGWSRFISTSGATQDATNGGGFGGLRGPLLGDPNFDMTKFDHIQHLAVVMSSAFAAAYDADNPAIGAFTAHGGKLLMWHGWSDPGPSPIGTISYYEKVVGSVPAAATNVRLYMAPGVEHCGGGPGPSQVDMVAALDKWVHTGTPPAALIATKAGAKISRPLCAYPATLHYKGAGDPDDASSFECR